MVMVIAIGVLAAVILCNQPLARPQTRFAADGPRRRIGLDSYERNARCEGAFPFDYLTR